uniref:WAT1-related protein n=1 Tax=Daucus carota subsp. sativus TaxID=79200 RepID=A0A161ZHQ7_DAUCS
MIVVQMSFSAMNIFYKLAAMDGMNLNILVAYRFLFAAAFMLPLALFVEGNKLMKLTWTILSQTFVSGLVGASLAQTFYLRGLAMSSATFAMATTNLVPVMTFILAVSLRSEKLGWDRAAGKVKVLGTIVGVTGAMILTFYKGPCIDIWNTHIDLLKNGASGVAFTMAAWCVQMRGPIFVSAFNPLTVVVGVFAASLLLDEKLHLGSVLGGVIIICGLYAVLWGKSNEMRKVDQLHALPVKSCNNQTKPVTG